MFLPIFAEEFGAAGFFFVRRKPQQTADFRRQRWERANHVRETGFSHLVSPFWRSPVNNMYKTLKTPSRHLSTQNRHLKRKSGKEKNT